MNNLEIKQLIDETTGINLSDRCRNDIHIKARYIFYKMCFKYSDETITTQKIGIVAKRDHSTVIHGLKVYDNLYETDKSFVKLSDQIEQEIIKNTTHRIKRYFSCIDNSNEPMLKRKVKNLLIKNRQLAKELKRIKSIEIN